MFVERIRAKQDWQPKQGERQPCSRIIEANKPHNPAKGENPSL